MAAPAKESSRPILATSMRSSSYLIDHQQYRSAPRKPSPPHQGVTHHGIDSVVEDMRSTRFSSPSSEPTMPIPFNGIPSIDSPPSVVDHGVTHSFSHPNCAPPAGHKTDRLVATLMYRTKPRSAASTAAAAGGAPSFKAMDKVDSNDSIPPTMAPTTKLEEFPLEPPSQQESDPQLDLLYGSYVSPMCISSFLHLMSTFPLDDDADEPQSSHRCLDSQESPRVVEVMLSPPPSTSLLTLDDLRKHEMIYRFEQEWHVDVILQKDTVWRRHPRLVVFDMDSTLITQEVIDLMAANISNPPDLAARVSAITHRAMIGELDFESSLRERVALLKGLPGSIFTSLRALLNITPGVRDLIKALKRLGVQTAVLSGGFLPLTGWLAAELGIDHAHANELVVEDDKLTGEVCGRIVGKEQKCELLVEIADREGIDISQTVAVGDGANDLLMIKKAGLGVAWNAKPRVQMEASARLNGESLLDLLYLFGFTSEEIDALTGKV